VASASGQLTPRAEAAARTPTRPIGHGTGASGQAPEKLCNTRGRSDVVARLVTIDRTRPIVCGCLLESTGRWHCGVRSVQAMHPVTWSATRFNGDRTLRPCPVSSTGAFGQYAGSGNLFLTALFFGTAYKSLVAGSRATLLAL
jgi:hypothetical protein